MQPATQPTGLKTCKKSFCICAAWLPTSPQANRPNGKTRRTPGGKSSNGCHQCCQGNLAGPWKILWPGKGARAKCHPSLSHSSTTSLTPCCSAPALQEPASISVIGTIFMDFFFLHTAQCLSCLVAIQWIKTNKKRKLNDSYSNHPMREEVYSFKYCYSGYKNSFKKYYHNSWSSYTTNVHLII